MKRLALIMLAVVGTANAAGIPQVAGSDTRIKTQVYDQTNVTVANASVGRVSRIIFERGEVITFAGSGFTPGWELTPIGNMLVIKAMSIQGVQPNPKEWNTNIIVSTNRRAYEFDLQLVSKDDPSAFYRIDFEYTEQAREQRKAVALAKVESVKVEAEKARAKSLIVNNYSYEVVADKKSRKVEPLTTWDNGTFTYFEFDKNSDMPVITVLDEYNQQHFPETHVDKENLHVLVVRQLGDRFITRIGKKAALITYTGGSR